MSKPWDVEHKWPISYFGRADKVRKQMPFPPKKFTVRDVTFCEGDDCVAYRVAAPNNSEILRLAVEMRVEGIDVGSLSMRQQQYDFCKVVAKEGGKVRRIVPSAAIHYEYTLRISSMGTREMLGMPKQTSMFLYWK